MAMNPSAEQRALLDQDIAPYSDEVQAAEPVTWWRLGEGGSDTRPDNPHGGWFKQFDDAIGQANFRAAVTGYRHRVHYDAANRWWNITEISEEGSDAQTS